MKAVPKIAIIGLAYVGLPLAQLFATTYKVLGFDIDLEWVNEINSGFDRTLEISSAALLQVLVPDHPCVDETRAAGLYCRTNLEHLNLWKSKTMLLYQVKGILAKEHGDARL